jgi:hypothetical protein
MEAACIHQLLSFTAPLLSNQEWQDIPIGSLEFKSSDSTCAKAHKHARRLLGSAIDDLNLNTTDLATSPPPPIKAWAILWHLSELNFRFELLALHQHARIAGHDAFDSDQDVRNALQPNSLQTVDMATAVKGFHCSDWRSRLSSLLQITLLMRAWSGDKPLPILHDQPLAEYSKRDTALLEDAVAQFHTDTFFVFFGHAAVIPTCLS